MANSKHIDVDGLQAFATGFAAANDARFTKKSDTGTLAGKNEVSKTELASALKTEIEGKANSADTLAGYGIGDAYTKAEVDAKVTGAFHYKGTVASTALTSDLLAAANVGNVYNVSDAFTTTADFQEGAGVKVAKGTNVIIANVGTAEAPSYKFDVSSSEADLSAYATREEVATASSSDIQAIVSGLYKESGE